MDVRMPAHMHARTHIGKTVIAGEDQQTGVAISKTAVMLAACQSVSRRRNSSACTQLHCPVCVRARVCVRNASKPLNHSSTAVRPSRQNNCRMKHTVCMDGLKWPLWQVSYFP